MALQVWLPLTDGTLKQQGLKNVSATVGGIVGLTDAGKLGKCATFSTTGSGITLPASAMTSFTECSVAFWINITAWNTSWDTIFQAGLSSTPWNNYIFGILRNQHDYLCFTISNGSTSSSGSYYSSNLTTGVWTHLAFTYETGKCKIYINGVLDKEYTTSIIPKFSDITNIAIGRSTNGSNYQSNCKLNDFRIYDHCLSSMEVKQISQGLVLHYPLNLNSTYTSLVDKTASYTIYNNHGVTASLIKQSGFFRGAPIYRLSMTPTSDTLYSFRNGLHSHGVYGWRQTFAASTKYVFWIYYKPVTHMDVRVGGTASNISGWTEIPPEYVGDGWYRVGQYRNGTVTEAKTDNIFTSFYTPTAEANVPIQIDFACPMLVQGLTEIQDSISYNTGNIVYDSSGYCNNGTITGTLSNTSDTPKYAVSTKITPNSNIQFTPMLTGAYSWTIAAWIKPIVANNDGKAWFSVEQNTYWQITCYSNQLGIRDNSIGGTGTRKNYSFGTIAANTWVHLVATYDNGTLKLYNNGVLQNTNTVGGTYLNAMNNGRWGSAVQDGYYWNGQMSDARIYATALSASDVKSLYQNCATIDPDGTIRGQIRS